MIWNVWGFLIGQKLPAGWFTLDWVEIHAVEPDGEQADEAENLEAHRFDERVDVRPPDDTFFVVSPAEIRLKTNCIVRFVVEAAGPEEARQTVQERSVPRLVAALETLVTDAKVKPFHVELLAVINPATGEYQGSYAPRWVYPVHPMPLTDSEGSSLSRRLAALSDPSDQAATLNELANYIYVGSRLADESMGFRPTGVASMLSYFRCIELIAGRVARSAKPSPDEIDSAIQHLVEKMQEAFNSGKDTDDFKKAIRQGYYTLQDIGLEHIKSQIEAAGTTLGLYPEIIDASKRFATFRNKRLAHPADEIPKEEWIHWFHQRHARRVAVIWAGAILDTPSALA